jgi:cytochrome c553
MALRTKIAWATLGFAVSLFGAGLSASAQDAPSGKQLYLTRTCVACHGKDASKAIQAYPNLAGLDANYLLAQMKDITAGKRVSGPDARGYPRTQAMKDVMVVVTEDELKIIAAWLATLPPPPIKPGDAALAAQGEALYGKSGCVACHGPKGLKPNPAMGAPLIAGQKKEYLALQLKEIRDGIRTNGETKLMVTTAKKLGDSDIDALAEFLSQVERVAAK